MPLLLSSPPPPTVGEELGDVDAGGDEVAGDVGDVAGAVGDGDEDWLGLGEGVGVSSAMTGMAPVISTTPAPKLMTSGFRMDRASTAQQPPHRIACVKLHAGLPHGSGKNHATTSRPIYQPN